MSIDDDAVLASRVRVVVLVSRVHAPTIQALAWAQAVGARTVEALTVQVDACETRRLMDAWGEQRLQIPLTAVASTGDLTEPVIDYLAELQERHPRDLIAVFIPQYVVGGWSEYLLHHSGARRLRAALRRVDGVTVTTVPWQLASARQLAGSP